MHKLGLAVKKKKKKMFTFTFGAPELGCDAERLMYTLFGTEIDE